MRRIHSRLCCFLSICLLSIVCVPFLMAQTTSSLPDASSGDRAVEAMRSGDYAEALARMQEAVQENPQDLELQYTLGGIYLRLHRLDEAEAIFLALLSENEERFRKVCFELASVALDRGKPLEALEMLRRAHPVDPGRADLESGLVHMKLGNYAKAAAFFEKVRSENPALAPRAMTQQAVALFHLGRLDEARKLLQDVLAMKPPPDTASEARHLLSSVEDGLRAKKKWAVNIVTGFQYDSNPSLSALSPYPGIPSSKEDGAHLFSLSARYDFYQDEAWKAGVGYNQYFLTYFRNSDLSLIGARPSVYLQYGNKPYYAGLQYIYSHYWAGGKSKVDVHSIFPTFTLVPGEHWRTETYGGVDWALYEDRTPDYRHYFLGLTEMYMMKGGRAHVRAGYRFEYEDLVPENSGTFGQHVVLAGVQWPILETRWFVDLSGQYIWRNFEFAPVISDHAKRRDNEQDLIFQVAGPINSTMGLAFIFQQVWNNSNITTLGTDPYNYRRTILSCLLTVNF